MIPHVLTAPAPVIEILEFNAAGTLLAGPPVRRQPPLRRCALRDERGDPPDVRHGGYPAPYTIQGVPQEQHAA